MFDVPYVGVRCTFTERIRDHPERGRYRIRTGVLGVRKCWPCRPMIWAAVVSAGGHFVSKWQPRVLATTICSKVAADSVGGRFGPN